MRGFQKQQIMNVIDSMHALHGEIRDRLQSGAYDVVEGALTDCQEAAISVGEAIEQIEGDDTKAVRCLEQYCERLYQISLQLQNTAVQKIYKSLESGLVKAENEIKHMPVRKTAVFLPYKASMWDSLESVWKAACDDEEWESVVIPIPYYNRNTDDSLGEMQYEGADFPEDVPVTDWQQYSLEKEHPDIIFIHNPYDQFNIVTTVHPLFYASRIKDYTEKLVYIPYFVHQNDMVAEHYCVLPGTIYADVVILQSEKVREQYLRYYEAALPELVEKQGREAIEKKFQALGSPKFDVSADSQNDIPEEWREFLGQGKKVIFFNTHLRGLMQGQSEQFLRKLEWVFNFFQKQEDVVLLWRPHPLMVETARAMNPEAVEPYLKLVDRYRRQKIGIYDDSRELHRAIDLSDAYYGSGSSVVELFRQQGKPVMLMSEQIRED